MGLRLFEDSDYLGTVIKSIYDTNLTKELSNRLSEEAKITASLYLTNKLDDSFESCGFRKNRYNASMMEIYECGLRYRDVSDNVLDEIPENIIDSHFRLADAYEIFESDIRQRIGKANLYTDLFCVNINGEYISKLVSDFIFRNADYVDPIIKQSLIDFLCSDTGQLFRCICQRYTQFHIVLDIQFGDAVESYRVEELHKNANGSCFILAINAETGKIMLDNIEPYEILNLFYTGNEMSFSLNDFVKYYDKIEKRYKTLDELIDKALDSEEKES